MAGSLGRLSIGKVDSQGYSDNVAISIMNVVVRLTSKCAFASIKKRGYVKGPLNIAIQCIPTRALFLKPVARNFIDYLSSTGKPY